MFLWIQKQKTKEEPKTIIQKKDGFEQYKGIHNDVRIQYKRNDSILQKMMGAGGGAGGGAGPVVPQAARNALAQIGIRQEILSPDGQTQNAYVGGRVFHNLQSVLPQGTTYIEHDVHLYVPGVNRGPERIVRGSDGRDWYTNDHYATFTQM